MSPEQARGKAVDRRADLWAFGCVLYEMLTRQRAFGGDSPTDVLAAVVTTEPDWTRLPAETPAAIRTLLRRCLEKNRARRLDSAVAARLEIDDALATPAAQTVVDPERIQSLGTAAAAFRPSLIETSTAAMDNARGRCSCRCPGRGGWCLAPVATGLLLAEPAGRRHGRASHRFRRRGG